jgi:NAD(P)-dependent dehydrogenase (short-subunit alcohol dehydrogenase family)
MGRLDGRVAIVTGAGRGLGRAHALCLAAHGASVVVNDIGGSLAGDGSDLAPAQSVVREIEASGGRAIASGHDVSDWDQARELVELAVGAFGNLHVLVNNAGILRDRSLAKLSEQEWDAVVSVHLKGHAAPTRHAMAFWKDQAPVQASVIHTSSGAGLVGTFGQAHYAAAKLGIVGLSNVVATEGARIGVRSNAIGPAANTRLAPMPGSGAAGGFKRFAAENVSPLVAWLALPDCPATGQFLHVYGDRVLVLQPGARLADLRTNGQWTLEALDAELPGRLAPPVRIEDLVELDGG